MSVASALSRAPPAFLRVEKPEELDFVKEVSKVCWGDAKQKKKMERQVNAPRVNIKRIAQPPIGIRMPVIQPIHVHVPHAYVKDWSLTDMDVTLNITGSSVELQVEQSYKNSSTSALELKFSTTLGDHVVISDFEIECDGKVSKGVIQGAAEARDTYDDAISSGHVAAIGERTDSSAFSMSIGNLQPGQQLKIRVTMLSPLAGFLDKLYFGLPAELFPNASGKYNLSLKSKVSMGQPATYTFYHGTHKVVNNDGLFAHTLSPDEPQIFAVQIEPAKPFEPVATVEHSVAHKTLTACVTFFPEWSHIDEDLLTPFVEVLFLVDRSGSMSGQRIQAASRTLSLFLSSLPENTMFNIVGFGTKFEHLFPKSVKYDASTRAKAQKHVDSLKADLGGTNLLEPLSAILSKEASDEFPRAVFVLTDGQVSNRDQVIQTVGQLALKNHSRVFAMGIGSGADAALVGGIAEAGGGQHDMIPDNTPMQPFVIKQLSQALEPSLRQVKLKWSGAKKGNLFPSKLPCVTQGERLTVYISELEAGNDPIVVTLSGVAPDASPISWNMTVSPTQWVEGEQVGRVAAWMECLELEQLGEQASKKRIRELGLKHRFATSQTSWVASLENESLSDGPMKTVSVGSKVKSFFARSPSPTRGRPAVSSSRRLSYGGPPPGPPLRDGAAGGAAAPSSPRVSSSLSSAAPLSRRSASPTDDRKKKMLVSEASQSDRKEKKDESTARREKASIMVSADLEEDECASLSAPARPSLAAPAAPPMKSASRGPSPIPSPKGGSAENKITLIGSLQDFQGFWKTLKDVEGFAGAVSATNPGAGAVKDATLAEQLWATALAIAFLTAKMADYEDQWTLLVKKARVWLKKTCNASGITVDFLGEAAKAMK